MLGLAEILATLLPPLLEKAAEIHRRGATGELTADEVRAHVESLRDAMARAKVDDDDIDRRIAGVR